MRRDDPGPYALEKLAAMPVPALFLTDAQAWKQKLVAWFEAESRRTLYPMQVEMLLIETLAYAMSILGEEGQMVVEQGLVAFAGIEGLERLGPNRSTPRLPAAAASVMLRFARPQALPQSVYIPKGTRVSAGGNVAFATTMAVSIAANALSADVAAVAVEAGVAGNGYQPGQIASLLDPVPGVTVSNINTSDGGADIEEVEAYRLRLANAFERVSTGGSRAWYRETAMAVSSALVDVAVVRPNPCYVDLYPLTATGAAAVNLQAQVLAAFNTASVLDIRFGDQVTVKPPVAVTAAPVVTVRVSGALATVATDARAKASAVLDGWGQRLGAAVAPSDIEAAIKALTGVVDVTVTGLAFQQLQAMEYLAVTSLTVNVVVLQ